MAAAGLEPARQTEPQRLRQQIKPEAVRIIPVDEARRIESTAAAPAAQAAECLQAGPFEDGQAAGLRQALESWPAGSWSLEPTVEPARWIVYMGKYATAENVSRKKAELRQMGIFFEALVQPCARAGPVAGRLPLAGGAISRWTPWRSAASTRPRWFRSGPKLRGQLLKLPAADDKLRARLEEIRPALGGKNLRPCR